jgi:hypothetical protein
MKKLFFTAVALLAFTFAQAQENSIKFNPLALLGGTDLVSFEHRLSDRGTGIIGAGLSGFKIGDAKYSSFGGELQYRYYFDEALSRWYVGGQAAYISGKVELENTSEETNFSGFAIGGKVGYQWLWDSGFTLDLNLGIANNSFNYDSKDGSFSTLETSGVLPNLGFALGYSF